MSGGDGFETKTCIFWNLEDCPIPEDLHPVSIYKNIKSALGNMNYNVGGTMSINAYAEETFPDELLHKHGVNLVRFRGGRGKAEREFQILWDCLLWMIRNHPKEANIVFIVNLSDDSEFINSEDYDEFLRILKSFKLANHNVIVAQPGEVFESELRSSSSSIWLSKSLLSGVNHLDLTGSFDCFTSAQDMEVLGMARLKIELQSRGQECEGSLQECAARLFFLLQSTSIHKVQNKYRAKKKN